MDAPLFGIEVQLPKPPPPALCAYFQLVIAEPPSPPALQLSATDRLPRVADGLPGASGAVWASGVTASDSGDSSPSPTPLTARTLNLYDTLESRPVTVWLVVFAPAPEIEVQLPKLAPPALCAYFQPVTAEPLLSPALQLSATERMPAVVPGLPGASGTAADVVKVALAISSLLPGTT